MGRYNIKVSSAIDFSCKGCSSFADYLTKAGIATFKSDNTACNADDSDAYVALENLLTKYNATKETLALLEKNFSSEYLRKSEEGDSSAFFKGLCKSQYNEPWVGKVTIPFYTGSGTDAITLILPGTIPQYIFHYDAADYGPGTFTITRSVSSIKLTLSDGTVKTFTNKHDGVIPLRIFAEIVGGGGGGGGTYHSVAWYHGTGGGGGGYACAVLDLASYPTITVELKARAEGGMNYNALESDVGSCNGSPGGSTIVKSGNTILMTAPGGKGGKAGLPGVEGGAGGAKGEVNENAAWLIHTSVGGAGGYAGADGTSMEMKVSLSDLFTDNVIEHSAAGGKTDGKNGGGGASCLGGPGGPGGGGNGGTATAIAGDKGNSGNLGYVKLRF